MISQVIPKHDKYYDNLPIMGRLPVLREETPEQEEFFKDQTTDVDENYFDLNWPSSYYVTSGGGGVGGGASEEEKALQMALEDWQELAGKVTSHTEQLVEGTKITMVVILYGLATLMTVGFALCSGMVKIGSGAGAENLVKEQGNRWWSSVFNKLPNFWK